MQKRHIALFVLTAALGAALGRAAPPINPYGLNTSGKLVPADNVPTSLLSGAISCTTAQGTGAGPTAPWAVELSDGTNYYVGPKTGQLPTALVGGRLDVNIGASSATVPVSGTFWQTTQPVSVASLPLPSGAATAANQPGYGTAGTPSANVSSIQGVVGGTPVPISGTITTTPGGTQTVAPLTGNIDAGNSSTSALLANATFTGIGVDVSGYSVVTTSVYSDQSGTLNLQFSNDNSHWDFPLSYAIVGGTGAHVQVGPQARYLRVVYTNGGTNQTTFRMQTIERSFNAYAPVVQASTAIDGSGDAILTKSIISGKTTGGGGSYVDVKVNPSGSIQVGGAVDIGQTNAASVLNSTPAGTEYALLTRNIPSGTQPISAASLPLPAGACADSSVNGLLVAQNSSTSGQSGPLVQGAVTTAAPTYTTARTSPLSLTTAGALRVDASASTQPVSGPLTDTQLRATPVPVSGTITPLSVAGTTPTLSVVAMTTTGAQVWAAASTAKVRKIYNQAANDTLYCVYYDGSNNVTSEATSQFSVLPGQTWEMPNFPGVVEYTGAVRCALKSATGNINATQVL